MKMWKMTPVYALLVLLVFPLFVLAYSNSDSPTFSYGDEDTMGTGIANAAAVESTGELKCYVDSTWIQTVAVAGVFGFDDETGSHAWTVSIDGELQAYMTRVFGFATITIQVVLLKSDYTEIESLTVWERDCVQTNPQIFNAVSIDESDTFSPTSDARYFGVWFYASAAWGATICQDSEHTESGYPAVFTIESITWSY